jgi:branched-chain amino acid transport system ATP-binding protein
VKVPAAAPASAPALELIDVRAGYGRIEVLHGVSFVIPPGKVFALLGPNGAGKSTTLKVVSGRMAPTAGCVHIAGSHVNGAKPHRLARAGVCSIPEGRGIFPNLAVAENLRMMAYRGGLRIDDVEEQAYLRFPVLGERRTQLAGTLSGGEQQMLAMARALVTDPSLLLLDEISMGLAPRIVSRLYEVVGQLADQGIALLVVEQFARTVLAIADVAAIMVHGVITRAGPPDALTDEVSAAYLGVTH